MICYEDAPLNKYQWYLRDVIANCTNTNGSHKCTCKEGYNGDKQSCHGTTD